MTTLSDSPVTGNTSISGPGGGIYNGGTVTLNDFPVTDNYLTGSGANLLDNCAPPGSVTGCSG